MKNNKLLRPIILAISAVVLLTSIIGIVCVSRKRVALSRQVNHSALQVRAARDKYQNKVVKVNEEAQRIAETSKNPALNTVAVQHYNLEQVKKVARKFFTIYYTWSDYKEYMKRSKKLSSIITPSLARNKTIFDDAKDKTGGNYLQSLGLHSKFESSKAYLSQASGNKHKAQALVKVVNESWYHDDTDNSGEATHYYDLTYNLDTHKISSLKLVFTEKNESSDEDGE